MSKKNLPIKLVLQKSTDAQINTGFPKPTYFSDVTPDLQSTIISKLENVLDFYRSTFNENALIPAVGKITVKSAAIAKSHKPNDFCRNLPIIGSKGLNEIYVRVSKKGIEDTVTLVKRIPSSKFEANLTAIDDIQPVKAEEKISEELLQVTQQGAFESIRNRIKIKLFDFNDEFDNSQIIGYVRKKLKEVGLIGNNDLISYGERIKYISVEAKTYDDIIRIASINGVKSVDFFQEYSLPHESGSDEAVQAIIDDIHADSDIQIGIIDGGISDKNAYLAPYVVAREVYVGTDYQNHQHGTFIASTIQYGNRLNNIPASSAPRFKFVDVVALPNSDPKFGPTDSIGEREIMEIIEEVMQKYASSTKIWNLSLGIESEICITSMSDLGVFLDYIQDKYHVQIFVSSGNLVIPPLRTWPPQAHIGDRDRIIAPADTIRGITVGSISLYESDHSMVKSNEPSPFSRRGPGPNNTVKPDLVDYGGNLTYDFDICGLGIKGLDINGCIIEGNGTSYSTPRVAQKFAAIYDEMAEKDLLLAKAMLIHSARMNSRDLLSHDQNNIKYYGYGVPSCEVPDILQCSEDEVTLVFKQKVVKGTHLEMFNFPYPPSLIRNKKCYGEIGMTLVYEPVLDERFGKEYCQANVDVSFGMYDYNKVGKLKFKGCVPLESTWDEKFEQARVEHGFKWSPIKSYYRRIGAKGIKSGVGWKVRVDLTVRNGLATPSQDFVLIITIKDPGGHDIYSEVVNGLRELGYVTNNLETRQQLRQR